VERFSTQKIILASIFLLALVVATAFFQIKLQFNTYIALAIMLIGTVGAARFLTGSQE
jgi:accessory gene regulator protein AgrB